MSNLNPLLQMFMKPDKKEIPETPVEKNETQNQSQKNDINEIKDHNAEPSKMPKTTKTKKDKEKPQNKKKKVLQDKLPDFEINDTPPQNKPRKSNFKYLSPKNHVFMLDDFKASSEWEDNLFYWFTNLRMKIKHLTSGDTIALKSVIALIQKGEMPKSNEACNVQDVEEILFYFERQTTDFTKADLAWIFSALIFTDRLLNKGITDCLSNIMTKMIIQVNSLQTK